MLHRNQPLPQTVAYRNLGYDLKENGPQDFLLFSITVKEPRAVKLGL